MALTYSIYLNISHENLLAKGVYNASLDEDSLLHVDPLLLKNCTVPEFIGAYDEFIQYFERFIDLVPLVQNRQTTDRAYRIIYKYFIFKEKANTGLGYARNGTYGKGISGELSLQLADTAIDIINAGIVRPQVFALLPLFEDNIGADRISDMAISILFERFIRYTHRVSRELGLKVEPFNDFGDIVALPVYRKRPIIFVPMSILTDLPHAVDFDDVGRVCDYNERLKRKVAELIGLNWEEYQQFHKSDVKRAILRHPEITNELLDRYERYKGVSYDFDNDNKDKYLSARLNELPRKLPLDLLCFLQEETPKSILSVCHAILGQVKELVENRYMWKIFHRKERTPDETDWQLYISSIAETYIIACQADIDVNREPDAGVGKIDFKFSRGVAGKTIVEVKRSSNKDLLHGYVTQLPNYMRSESAEYGIYVIIKEAEQNNDKIQAVYDRQEALKRNGEYAPDIVLIDAQVRQTASKSEL